MKRKTSTSTLGALSLAFTLASLSNVSLAANTQPSPAGKETTVKSPPVKPTGEKDPPKDPPTPCIGLKGCNGSSRPA